jgi:catechol 2,3-dioxygenase-like lactoylglutathione lyase family enzyme
MPRLLCVVPIAAEELLALPVHAIDSAVQFYQQALGFQLVHRDGDTRALLRRDDIELGLVALVEHNAERARYVAIETDDLAGLHDELHQRGARPGEFGLDAWNGRSQRTFFVREPRNGYCYCFFTPLAEEPSDDAPDADASDSSLATNAELLPRHQDDQHRASQTSSLAETLFVLEPSRQPEPPPDMDAIREAFAAREREANASRDLFY